MALPKNYYHMSSGQAERDVGVMERAQLGRSNFAFARANDIQWFKAPVPTTPDVKPDSAPPNGDDEPVTTQQIVFIGARYAIYSGIGWLVADTWLGGRGLVGAGVGLVGGYMLEQALAHQLMTEDS